MLFVVNKWDLARDKTDGLEFQEYLTKMLPALSYAPISLASATEKLNIIGTVNLAKQISDQAYTRVSTSAINNVIQEILVLRGPSHKAGTKPPKILYASQVATAPPTIVCFVNDVRSFDETYRRFLINRMRERLPFAEVPIRLLIRQRRKTDRIVTPRDDSDNQA